VVRLTLPSKEFEENASRSTTFSIRSEAFANFTIDKLKVRLLTSDLNVIKFELKKEKETSRSSSVEYNVSDMSSYPVGDIAYLTITIPKK
jgi:UPF0288 family protein (methanogenesis marker protein 3)